MLEGEHVIQVYKAAMLVHIRTWMNRDTHIVMFENTVWDAYF
jgi:hypothetical protein